MSVTHNFKRTLAEIVFEDERFEIEDGQISGNNA